MSKDDPNVVYRQVKGNPGYRVGDDGSVWSLWERAPRPPGTGPGAYYAIGITWRRLRVAVSKKKPHPSVQLRGNEHYVHHLVLEAFVGPRPSGMQGCHDDGVPTNNKADNLRWDTPKGNHADRVRHGTDLAGADGSNAKLTIAAVRAIRKSYAAGRTVRQLATRYAVHTMTIYRIVRRQIWTKV